jgi:regulator of sigma E protease
MVVVNYWIADGFAQAIVEPFDFIVMNLKGLGMLISGKLDVRQNLSGPIRIAKIAGDTAHYRGLSAFIILMAKISIILMVMNLLPIPVVDGSFILFFLYEAIKGSPINQKVMEKIQFVGIVLLIMLGIFVIFNDLSFLPFFQNLFD